MEHVGNGGERLHDDATGVQDVTHLLERDPSLARHNGSQLVRMLLQQGTPVAANLGWGQTAGLAHPLHQLDGRRGAHGEAAGRMPNGAPIFDDPHDPLPEILGQGGRHDQLHHSRPRHPGIRSSDSVQDRTALARRSAEYGVAIESPIKLDMKRVKARADTVSTNARTGVETWLRGMEG